MFIRRVFPVMVTVELRGTMPGASDWPLSPGLGVSVLPVISPVVFSTLMPATRLCWRPSMHPA